MPRECFLGSAAHTGPAQRWTGPRKWPSALDKQRGVQSQQRNTQVCANRGREATATVGEESVRCSASVHVCQQQQGPTRRHPHTRGKREEKVCLRRGLGGAQNGGLTGVCLKRAREPSARVFRGPTARTEGSTQHQEDTTNPAQGRRAVGSTGDTPGPHQAGTGAYVRDQRYPTHLGPRYQQPRLSVLLSSLGDWKAEAESGQQQQDRRPERGAVAMRPRACPMH